VEAWEKAFVAISKTAPNVLSLAKECFAAGYTFALDPVAFNALTHPPE